MWHLIRVYIIYHSSSTISDTSTSSKIDFFKIYDKYGKELRCPNIPGSVIMLFAILKSTYNANKEVFFSFCVCLGFTTLSTPWGHVERGQFT